MKPVLIILMLSAMILTSLACSFTTLMDNQAGTQPEPTGTETPVGKPTIVEPFLPPTDSATEGFQSETALDPAALPVLTTVAAGGEPTSCYSENAEPAISLGYGIIRISPCV